MFDNLDVFYNLYISVTILPTIVRGVSEYLAMLAMCSGVAFADNGNGVVVTARSSDDCQVTPVIHVLQYPGCVPKPIPSFACTGRCSSYLQVYAHII